jgi:hypothetical protein
VGLANLGSESETCVGSRVHLVGVSISLEKNFYQLPFTPPLSGSPYWSIITPPRGRVGVPPRRNRMDFANPTFEQMARHWFVLY